KAKDLADYEITDEVYSAVTGAAHLYLRQVHQGLPVYNGQLQVNINREGRIQSVNNAFMPDIAKAVNTSRPALKASAAVERAAKHLGLDGPTPGKPVNPQLMWLPIQRGQVRLVWNFQLYTKDQQHVYDFTVDAASGMVWTRIDWVSATEAQYTVYPLPVESPIHTSPGPPSDARVLVIDPADLTASSLRWHDDGTTQRTITRGNNVHAYEDRDGNNTPPASETDCNDGAGFPHCNFPIDLNQDPSVYIDAAVTNLFYWNNIIHDVQFQYGFDEAAGNFQVTNFTPSGSGGDDVRAEAQDNVAFGNCNANFFTPADGSRPRMQMFLCRNTSPARDGDLDTGVIIHEYGHGISNRQVGGPSNVSCLGNSQQPGEGWSDWHALAYTSEVGDAGTDQRGVGSYLFGLAPTGTIRPQPYSTDPGINNYTYESISGLSVPHGVGSVWAQAIWEVFWKLVDNPGYGFDPNIYNATGNAGNQRALLYINEGLKNTACSPTFTDTRDGIIQAATDNHGGEDVCLLWEAFAAFGLGTDATSGGPNSTNATNGFSVPAACQGDPCGNGTCDAGEDCDTCPADCISGTTVGAVCGNNICETDPGDGEDCLSCPQDCNGTQSGKPANRFCCGDGDGQNPVSCADPRCTTDTLTCTDVPATSVDFCCGDGLCNGAETIDDCAIDCAGSCSPVGASCTDDIDCCSNKCRGPSGGKTCK
ncbi:MAG: M36 family metallopeptidase, partial [Thermoanaerobaculia bacterium]